jgi:hypothetical protein
MRILDDLEQGREVGDAPAGEALPRPGGPAAAGAQQSTDEGEPK